MGFSFLSAKKRIINLVFNDHSIRMVEIKQTNPLTVQTWRERFIPPAIIEKGKIIDEESLANIIEECIEEWGIQRRSVQFIVPDSLVIIRKVSVPVEIQDDEIKGYLYLELGASIHLPFDEPVFDIFMLPNQGKKKEMLLFAAPEKDVLAYTELLSSLKLHPIAADITPLALYRIYHQLDLAQKDEVLFTIQADLTGVTLCIFNGSVPLVMRHFALPFNLDQWEIKSDNPDLIDFKYIGEMEELSMQFEDVVREITMLLDFYRYSLNSKQDVTKFLLNGDHPMFKLILSSMKERFETPVTTIPTYDIKSINGGVPANLLLTLGLGLKEVK